MANELLSTRINNIRNTIAQKYNATQNLTDIQWQSSITPGDVIKGSDIDTLRFYVDKALNEGTYNNCTNHNTTVKSSPNNSSYTAANTSVKASPNYSSYTTGNSSVKSSPNYSSYTTGNSSVKSSPNYSSYTTGNSSVKSSPNYSSVGCSSHNSSVKSSPHNATVATRNATYNSGYDAD